MASDSVRCSDCNRSRLSELHSSTDYITTVITWNLLRLRCVDVCSFPAHFSCGISDPYQCTREGYRPRFRFALEYVAYDILEFAIKRLGPSLNCVCQVSFARGLLKTAMLTFCFCSAMFQRLGMLRICFE